MPAITWLNTHPIAWAALAVLLLALVGSRVALWWEQRHPTSYTENNDLAWWGLLSADEQEDIDNAALERGAQADIDARQAAAEAAEFAAHRAQFNTLYHP